MASDSSATGSGEGLTARADGLLASGEERLPPVSEGRCEIAGGFEAAGGRT
jgi:hypothetical protein